MADVKTQTVSETRKERLVCKLTDEEQQLRGLNLSRAVLDFRKAEVERKRIMAHHKGLVEKAAAKVDDLTTIVHTGQEYRQVEVRDDHDFRLGIVRTVRTDTGKVIKSRPMTDEDRQDLLPVLEEREEMLATPEEAAGMTVVRQGDGWGPRAVGGGRVLAVLRVGSRRGLSQAEERHMKPKIAAVVVVLVVLGGGVALLRSTGTALVETADRIEGRATAEPAGAPPLASPDAVRTQAQWHTGFPDPLASGTRVDVDFESYNVVEAVEGPFVITALHDGHVGLSGQWYMTRQGLSCAKALPLALPDSTGQFKPYDGSAWLDIRAGPVLIPRNERLCHFRAAGKPTAQHRGPYFSGYRVL